jgi:intracellular septation protein
VAYTVIEMQYGLFWGVVAGMALGAGEIAWEIFRRRKVSAFTWAGNAFVLVLGAIALLTQEGIWFRLQPAIFEAILAAAFFVSAALGKPLLVVLVESQGLALHPVARDAFRGITLRLGLFFLLHTALAVWAALAWSTAAWVLLKGVGLTLSLLLYMGAEFYFLRARLRKHAPSPSSRAL